MSWLKKIWQDRKVSITEAKRQIELPGQGAVMVARSVDCMGAVCPRPQLLTMKMIDELNEGDVIEVISDNPSSVETIPSLAMVLCSSHLATVRDQEGWRIYIRKGL